MTSEQETVPQIYRQFAEGGQAGPAADRIAELSARVPLAAAANRAWVRRAVTYLASEGVTQFLDVGSAYVESGSVHEIAQAINPVARVLYVDIDPDTVRQAAQAGDERVGALEGDLTRPAELLARLGTPEAQRVLNLDEPVAVLLAAVLHFVPDDVTAVGSVAALRDRLVPGSYLGVSHGATEGWTADEVATLQAAYKRETSAARNVTRTHGQVTGFFGDFELVEPGVGWVSEWRPELDPKAPVFAEPRHSGLHAGVAQKG